MTSLLVRSFHLILDPMPDLKERVSATGVVMQWHSSIVKKKSGPSGSSTISVNIGEVVTTQHANQR